jgi:hypothetical protein
VCTVIDVTAYLSIQAYYLSRSVEVCEALMHKQQQRLKIARQAEPYARLLLRLSPHLLMPRPLKCVTQYMNVLPN